MNTTHITTQLPLPTSRGLSAGSIVQKSNYKYLPELLQSFLDPANKSRDVGDVQLKLKVTEDTNELPKKDKIETSNENTKESNPKQELDPTRFGDWEKNGRCSDF